MKAEKIPAFSKALRASALLTLIVWTGCSNPADDVAEAKVEEAQQLVEQVAAVGNQPLEDARTFVASDESTIGFVGSKVTGSHEGGFKAFTASLQVSGGQLVPDATRVEIDMDSTWSDSDRLTGHLKNEDFFNVPAFPSASFVSTALAKDEQGHQVTGQLTLHGVTKTITFPASIEVSEESVKVDAEFFIKRFDFGIQYPGRADDLIRDEVVIKLHIVAHPEQA
jgi:polyisoprenoid-binding protein YceI